MGGILGFTGKLYGGIFAIWSVHTTISSKACIIQTGGDLQYLARYTDMEYKITILKSNKATSMNGYEHLTETNKEQLIRYKMVLTRLVI